MYSLSGEFATLHLVANGLVMNIQFPYNAPIANRNKAQPLMSI